MDRETNVSATPVIRGPLSWGRGGGGGWEIQNIDGRLILTAEVEKNYLTKWLE